MIFKNRAVQVEVVKKQKPTTESGEESNLFDGVVVASAYADIAKNLITHASLTIGGVFIICKIVERICR